MAPSHSVDPMTTEPAMPAPAGVISNFDNPESKSSLAIGLCSLIFVIMMMCFAGRLYTKIAITKMFGSDDWLCIIAAANTIAYTACAIVDMTTGAVGPHMWNVRKSAFNDHYFGLLLWGMLQTYGVQLFLRLCIFALLLRIFDTHNVARYLTYAGIAVVTILYPILFALTAHYCAPSPGGSPMAAIMEPSCQEKGQLITIIAAGASIVLDIYMIMIPQLVVWRLHASAKNRLKVAGVFAIALVATTMSAATMHYRLQYGASSDISWDSIPVYICSIWEANLGMICACIPCMPALFKSLGWRSSRPLRSRTPHFNTGSLTKRSKTKDKTHSTDDSISLVTTNKIMPSRSTDSRFQASQDE